MSDTNIGGAVPPDPSVPPRRGRGRPRTKGVENAGEPTEAGVAAFLVARAGVWDRGAPLLPTDSVEENVNRFSPNDVPPEVDAQIRPLIAPVVNKLATTPAHAGKLASAMTQLAWWCFREGLAMELEVILHPAVIDRYGSEGCNHLAKGTGANYRSTLRRVGQDMLGPPLYSGYTLSLPRSEVRTPYSDDDIPRLISWARGLPTKYMRDNTMATIAFGLGTASSTMEYLATVGTDLTEDEFGLVLNITVGRSPRSVPVLRAWEDPIREVLGRVGNAPVFRPDRTAIGRNDLTAFIDSCPRSDAPRLCLSRLRSTWYVYHLRVPTPPRALAIAAGVTANQISKYVRFVPDPDPVAYRSLIRDATLHE